MTIDSACRKPRGVGWVTPGTEKFANSTQGERHRTTQVGTKLATLYALFLGRSSCGILGRLDVEGWESAECDGNSVSGIVAQIGTDCLNIHKIFKP